MPLFVWSYLAGLLASAGVGLLFYALVGHSCWPLIQSLFGGSAGAVWGRAFRVLLVLTAVMGGLSTRWYGCSYTDYDDVARDPRRMVQKSTEQVSQSFAYATRCLVIASAIGALTFAALQCSTERGT